MGSRPEPLYLFTLPPALLADITPRQLSLPSTKSIEPAPSLPQLPPTTTKSGLFNCTITGATFTDLDSLKAHYKSDWYKYNVKLRLKGITVAVSEEDFDKLVEELSASISGSDSSASSTGSIQSNSSSTNAVSRLLRKQQLDPAQQNNDNIEEDDFEGSLSGPRSALLWFEAPNAAPGTQYGIYRAALPIAGFGKQRQDPSALLKEVRSLQLPEYDSPKAIKGKLARGEEVKEVKERTWTMLMFGGGHFAGMVVSLIPRMVSKGKGKEKEREVVILQKKTFHRYTTRRKQGGSQAANDNAKGAASSAGAALRRYNETALTEDVRTLLNEWREEIGSSELIFLRASKTNYRTFFGYEGAAMDKKDPRIRGFSFPTRRPTLSELSSAFIELTRVKTSHLSADALAELDAAYIASVTPAPAPIITPKVIAPKPVVVRLSPEEELERNLWERGIEMIKKGRVEAFAAFVEKYGQLFDGHSSEGEERGVWGTVPSWREESRNQPTLLHIASAADQPETVRWLLVEKRADPTYAATLAASLSSSLSPRPPSSVGLITNSDTPSSVTPRATANRALQTPYELAPSRQTRIVFRLLATEQPDWYDWTGSGPLSARIPSALNIEKEEEKERKAKEFRDKLREKQRLREAEAEEKAAVVRAEEERKMAEEKERERLDLVRRGANKVEKTGPQRLGGGPSARIVRASGAPVLSEVDQMRVDRERRARAAEARFAKPA